MRVHILDKKIIDGKSWFLGKVSLWDYLSSVTPDNFEFDIQRGIVKNRYLDSILLSINTGEAIPPITITVDNGYINDTKEELSYISINDGEFNILDGLQRTYRLWLYKELLDIAKPENNLFGDPQYNVNQVVTALKNQSYYIPGVLSISQIKTLLNNENSINISKIEEIYKRFDIYLYIWSGLSEKDIIQKMLILNAGQRKVSIGHQYELMFLQIFKDKQRIPHISLIREKDDNYILVKTGKRNIGEFIFSSTIIGIQSLIAGKPIRLSLENLEFGVDDEYISEEQLVQYFNQPFLNIYLNSLYEIDDALSHINEDYLKWFVKDTTISGIMGAIGNLLKTCKGDYNEQYERITKVLKIKIKTNDCFDVKQFYDEYNKLSTQKINIGDRVRTAIYNYTLGILNENPITWSNAFSNNVD